MNRIVLAAALLMAAATAAQADYDVYTDMRKPHRGDAVLNADEAACKEQTGQSNFNGAPMLSSYVRCMRARGWRFDHTAVTSDYHHRWIVPGVTWTDPDRPGTCHYILGGLGSDCSNY
jgi:hypothetical protein